MPTLGFGDDDGCGLPPFSLVSNKLFFFRVNVFDIPLPTPDDGKGRGGIPPGKGRLGLPITDLFPDLMPEFGPQLHDLRQFPARLDRNIYLPAARANRLFDSARTLDAATADLTNGSVTVDGKSIVLSLEDIANLRAGRPVSLVDGKSLLRVRPPPERPLDDSAPARKVCSPARPSDRVHIRSCPAI